jgi:tetratricopeptide (TPR) repeat protein
VIAPDTERFEVLHEVGRGGFGVVFQARDRVDGSIVAIKVLHVSSDVADARFDREALSLSQLRHPSIVRYIAHGRTPAGRFLVMEWLEGCTLQHLLTTARPSVSDVVVLARRMLEALAEAHRFGLVHRDIKPANVFLVSGQMSQAKLLDFGIARRVEDSQSLTRTGHPLGTPRYMSPEQAHGEVPVDARTDVFSLGAVLYECLAGMAPFDSPHVLATLMKIVLEEPAPLQSLQPNTPTALAQLVHAMLAKKPGDRPSLDHIARQLEQVAAARVLAGGPLAREVSAANTIVPSNGQELGSALDGRTQQRVLCVLFVAGADQLDAATARRLEQALASFHVHAMHLAEGSRVLILGSELAAGDPVVAAARCALALRRLLPEAAISVCTGRAVVGSKQPFGEIFDRGAALLEETSAGVVQLDEASAALLDRRFEIRRDPGAAVLEDERRDDETPRTLLGRATPFIGRERELAQLELCFRECEESRVARAVLVTAAAGAGKSRLRHEFAKRLRRTASVYTLLLARGDPMRAGAPFSLLAHALSQWAEVAVGDEPARKHEKLLARTSELFAGEQARLIAAFLGEIVDAPFPEQLLPQLDQARADPRLMADLVLTSFLDWLARACDVAPLVLMLEDLHWADEASVRLLEAGLRSVGERPLLVLAFARPEVREAFPRLWAERDVLELRLPKLSARACEQLLDGIAGVSLSATTRARLVERADGNPFFLEELVRGAASSEYSTELPDTILGIIQARLDRLGEQAKLLLRAASVFGEAFRIDGVMALLGVDAADFDLPGWLALLAERELVFARGSGEHREYVFRHSLIRDASYALLADADRALAHQLAARWLERQGTTEPVVLADHFEKGQLLERAAHYHHQAALDALDAGSLEQVVHWGERAIACGVEAERLGELASIVAEALSCAGHDAQAVAWAQRARGALARGAESWWRASAAGAVSALRSGDGTAIAAEIADEMVAQAAAGTASAGQLLAFAQVLASAHLFGPDQRHRVETLLERVPEDSPSRVGGMIRLARASVAYQLDARVELALHHADAGLRILREVGSPRDHVDALALCGWFLEELGMHEQAAERFEEQLALGRRLGVDYWVCSAQENLGLAELRRGQPRRAQSLLEEAAAGYRQIGMPVGTSYALSYLAEAVAACADPEAAAQLASEAIALAAHDASASALALATAARIDLGRDRNEAALASATQAMHVLSASSIFQHAALTHAVYVESLLACQRTDEARAALATAEAWLLAVASRVQDDALRTSFLTRVPENARLLELAPRWLRPDA